MALIRWQPFQEIETLRTQFDQLFDELAGSRSSADANWMPAVELQDRDNSLILRAQIPGVEGKDLNVQVTRDAVYIAGEHRYEKKDEQKGYFRSEFRYGKFQRTIPLPVHVRNEQVQAEFNNGILTLTLPKLEELQHRVVKLNLGANTSSSSTETTANGEGYNAEGKYQASDQTGEQNNTSANSMSESAVTSQ